MKTNYEFKLECIENNIVTFAMKECAQTKVKLFILEEDIVRVLFIKDELKFNKTWSISPNGHEVPFSGRDKMSTEGFSLPSFETSSEGDMFKIETAKLALEINLHNFQLSWTDKTTGFTFLEDRKTQSYNFGQWGEKNYHYIKRNLTEDYYGLGEKSGDVNKNGRRYRMLNIDAMGYDAQFTDPLYKHIPFYITRNRDTKFSFGIFYDNLSTSVFDMGLELDNYHGYYRFYESEMGDLDYYVIAGPQIKDVVKRYTWMTGKTIFMPKWSIGYSGSTMTYTDAPNAQERLNEFVENCEKHDIMCDSFQLSSGYTSIGDKRYVFNWNTDKFPDAKGFTKKYHEYGVKLCANIKPCLLIDHPLYSELENKGMFIKETNSEKPEMAQYWDELGAHLDFTKEEVVNFWKDKVKTMLLDYGIDSTWNDNNEYEIWNDYARCYGFGQEVPVGMIRPLFSLLMMRASYEAQIEHSPEVRPYLISRSGCPGMHRYVQTWTGDNRTDWKTIRYNNRMAVGMNLSGIYNVGHDVGGFSGLAPSPELFVRWVQNGIFYPRFTIHSWNDDKSVNEPWMYPEVTEHIREAIKLRKRITPYIYNLLYRASAHNEPILRPTFYQFEEDEKTFRENDDFMLGDSMLVATVVEEAAETRRVYLPKHNGGWYSLDGSQYHQSGKEIELPVDLAAMPAFMKEGSILPLNVKADSFKNKDEDARKLMIYPIQGEGEFTYELYEDDGISNNYLKGDFKKITVTVKCTAEDITAEIQMTGDYVLPYGEISFMLPAGEKRVLKVK